MTQVKTPAKTIKPALEDEQPGGDQPAASVDEVKELEEAEKLLGIRNALEDLAFVADTITEVTPREAAFIQIAGNMALTGTDVDTSVLVPGLESHGGRVDTSRIKAVVAKIDAERERILKKKK